LKSYEEEHRPIVIHLNGHVHHTDRLALREIARQVVEQTGSKLLHSEDTDDDNPFDESETGVLPPPPAHLPSLIAALPTLSRPVVVLLDQFNVFTEQPRQALLYCLLDTVQSCRAGSPSQNGFAVVGLTSRIDVVNFLEKRVKSRFSHRIFRTANIRCASDWSTVLKNCLLVPNSASDSQRKADWQSMWSHSVEAFLADKSLVEQLRDMFGISRDLRGLLKVMVSGIAYSCSLEVESFKDPFYSLVRSN
jgi:origin recognition complex subunit 4